MRYYNTETRSETLTYVSPTITIPEDDIRVKAFFEALPIGKMLDFDANGLPLIIYIPVVTTSELEKARIAFLGQVTDRYIQSIIESYNDEFGVKFGSVHNCESYSRVANYTHQPFCLAVWDWSVNVWETVRSLSTMPTDTEFKAVLNGVSTNDTALQARLDIIDPVI